MGCRQVVRLRILVPAFGGSSPSTPAKEKSRISHLMWDIFYFIPDLSGLEANPMGSTRKKQGRKALSPPQPA